MSKTTQFWLRYRNDEGRYLKGRDFRVASDWPDPAHDAVEWDCRFSSSSGIIRPSDPSAYFIGRSDSKKLGRDTSIHSTGQFWRLEIYGDDAGGCEALTWAGQMAVNSQNPSSPIGKYVRLPNIQCEESPLDNGGLSPISSVFVTNRPMPPDSVALGKASGKEDSASKGDDRSRSADSTATVFVYPFTHEVIVSFANFKHGGQFLHPIKFYFDFDSATGTYNCRVKSKTKPVGGMATLEGIKDDLRFFAGSEVQFATAIAILDKKYPRDPAPEGTYKGIAFYTVYPFAKTPEFDQGDIEIQISKS